MNNSNSINVLKVVATLMVYFCHSTIVYNETYFLTKSDYPWLNLFDTPAWGGVWIFLVIGGYLAAYGFMGGGKYGLENQGFKMYAWNRIAKILIPTWVFVSMAYIFYFREEPLQYGYLLLMALCLFNGPGLNVNGIGASWYVFMCMWLYFLTPFFCRYVNNYADRHKGAEFKSLARLLIIVCVVGACFRLCTFFLKLDWYNWTYANPVACADMFIAGVIACKMTSYLPTIDNAKLKLYKRMSIAMFVFSGIVFTVKYPNIHGLISCGYAYLGASWYLLLTTAILLLYSYNDTSGAKRPSSWVRLCNSICPYTFTFYLWHSLILMSMVPKFTIGNHFLQYLIVMASAFVVTAYVAYITTKMNQGISKALLSLESQ